MWQVHDYFHRWQRQRYKDGLPYANYNAMSAHLTVLKKTTHRHWRALPSQAIQCELRRIDTAYQRFFKKLGGKPHIKPKHKFKSMTFPGASGWKIKENRISINLKNWNETKINGKTILFHIVSINTVSFMVKSQISPSNVITAEIAGCVSQQTSSIPNSYRQQVRALGETSA